MLNLERSGSDNSSLARPKHTKFVVCPLRTGEVEVSAEEDGMSRRAEELLRRINGFEEPIVRE